MRGGGASQAVLTASQSPRLPVRVRTQTGMSAIPSLSFAQFQFALPLRNSFSRLPVLRSSLATEGGCVAQTSPHSLSVALNPRRPPAGGPRASLICAKPRRRRMAFMMLACVSSRISCGMAISPPVRNGLYRRLLPGNSFWQAATEEKPCQQNRPESTLSVLSCVGWSGKLKASISFLSQLP